MERNFTWKQQKTFTAKKSHSVWLKPNSEGEEQTIREASRDLEEPVSQQPMEEEGGSCRGGLWGLGHKSLTSALGFAEPLWPYHLLCAMALLDKCYYPNLRAQA